MLSHFLLCYAMDILSFAAMSSSVHAKSLLWSQVIICFFSYKERIKSCFMHKFNALCSPKHVGFIS